ncbi:hypothetical protein BC940DRAFT_57139 [Gongronella butleri]|nr:hypothetical protein BC940DRAFT_57139 [Gongronella butleri]
MTLTQITTPRGETIAGILELRPQIDLNREKPRLVLICHGSLGHKNYIYQKKLAEQLPFSSFRFDFRGNGDSSGESTYAGMQVKSVEKHTP